MGRLIKHTLARLLVLTAAFCIILTSYTFLSANIFIDQMAAAIECFFWPKVFWDFLTKNLDNAVRPVPVLQFINLIISLGVIAWEWPLNFENVRNFHRNIEARLIILPLAALAAALIYQAVDAAIYYLIGWSMYLWSFYEREVIPIS